MKAIPLERLASKAIEVLLYDSRDLAVYKYLRACGISSPRSLLLCDRTVRSTLCSMMHDYHNRKIVRAYFDAIEFKSSSDAFCLVNAHMQLISIEESTGDAEVCDDHGGDTEEENEVGIQLIENGSLQCDHSFNGCIVLTVAAAGPNQGRRVMMCRTCSFYEYMDV